MKSILGSEDYHEQQTHLYVGVSQLFSAKNVLILICKNWCHRSVANAESWSNMVTRYGRLLHSVSTLHPSELNVRKDMCTGTCSKCSKRSANIYHTHHCCVHAECSRLVSKSASVTEFWKQLRRKSLGRRHEQSKSLRSTSFITKLAELNTKLVIFSEMAERLRNFRESADALPDRLHTGDITSQTDPNAVEATKHLYHKLLRKVTDDLERVPPRPCESSVAEVTRRRCLRHETSKGKSCLRPEAPNTKPCSPTEKMVEKPCSRPETTSEEFRSLSETIIPSREQLEQVACCDFRNQFELSVFLYRPCGSTSSRCLRKY